MIDPTHLRDTLRFWASGVSVVCTATADQRAGMTVSAFNSLSIDPPLILVCLAKETTTAHLLQTSQCFAVSILADHMADLSDRFAGRVPLPGNESRFDGVAITTAETGAPILTDAIAWLDCAVETQHDGSTHWIVIGRVVAAGYRTGQSPLLYFDRDYRTLSTRLESAPR
jgi:flavin reductase (DIM6/NTAB) family NADH-FMN oxidoreductase RutF